MGKLNGFALYFKSLRELGIDVRIHFHHLFEGNKELHFLEHDDFDGVGGILHLRRKIHPDLAPYVPRVEARQRPSFLKCLLAYLKFLKHLPYKPAAWKKLNEKNLPAEEAVHFFSIEESRLIREKARSKGVSLNAHILASLNTAVTPWLSDGPRIWMLPASLHENPAEHGGGTDASFVDLRLESGATPAFVEQETRRLLSENLHWGAWMGMQLSGLWGKWYMKAIIPAIQKQTMRTGALSNVGYWQGSSTQEEGWLVIAPAFKELPLTTGACSWGERLAVGVNLHPSIVSEEGLANKILTEWIKNLD